MPLRIVRNKIIIIFCNKWEKLQVMYFIVCMLLTGQISFACNISFYLQGTFGSLNSLCLLALEHKEIENQYGLKTFTCTYSKVVVKHNSHNFIFCFYQ